MSRDMRLKFAAVLELGSEGPVLRRLHLRSAPAPPARGDTPPDRPHRDLAGLGGLLRALPPGLGAAQGSHDASPRGPSGRPMAGALSTRSQLLRHRCLGLRQPELCIDPADARTVCAGHTVNGHGTLREVPPGAQSPQMPGGAVRRLAPSTPSILGTLATSA